MLMRALQSTRPYLTPPIVRPNSVPSRRCVRALLDLDLGLALSLAVPFLASRPCIYSLSPGHEPPPAHSTARQDLVRGVACQACAAHAAGCVVALPRSLLKVCSDGIAQDIIDFVEPVMLIVGSRGLGQLKG